MTAFSRSRGDVPAAPVLAMRADVLIDVASLVPALTWPAWTDDYCIADRDQGPPLTIHMVLGPHGTYVGVTDAWPEADPITGVPFPDDDPDESPPPGPVRTLHRNKGYRVSRDPAGIQAALVAALSEKPCTRSELSFSARPTQAVPSHLLSPQLAALVKCGQVEKYQAEASGRLLTFYRLAAFAGAGSVHDTKPIRFRAGNRG